MTETEQPNQPKQELLKTAAPWVDTFSKGVAGIAVALYASGFLIVSLYHSKYGFVGTNPFRPRVLAAGAWFFLFTAIPVSAAVALRKEPWLVTAKRAYIYWITCFGLSIPFGNVMFYFSTEQTFLAHGKWTWLFVAAAVCAIIALDVVSNKTKKVPQWVPTILSLFVTFYFVWYPLKRLFADHYFETSTIALWFFATTPFPPWANRRRRPHVRPRRRPSHRRLRKKTVTPLACCGRRNRCGRIDRRPMSRKKVNDRVTVHTTDLAKQNLRPGGTIENSPARPCAAWQCWEHGSGRPLESRRDD